MYCNSVKSELRRPSATSCRVRNANPRTNAYFIAFVIGEHAVLQNWFIHLAVYTKTNKCYSLILMVLCYSMITCNFFLWETGLAFYFDICRIIDQCSPNCLKKWNGKMNCRIHVVQVCLRLVGACNRPFYNCVLSCQAFDLEWGWKWPCCDKDQYLVSMITK